MLAAGVGFRPIKRAMPQRPNGLTVLMARRPPNPAIRFQLHGAYCYIEKSLIFAKILTLRAWSPSPYLLPLLPVRPSQR